MDNIFNYINFCKNISLKWKQVVSYLLAGMVPLAVVMLISSNSFEDIRVMNATNLQTHAQNIADKIDRNLFERYGDVQAFGLNKVVQNREHWYKLDSPIVDAMNSYVDTYDIYYLTVLLDLDGRVIAVNTKDQNSKNINTSGIFSKNYSNNQWFNDVLSGRFYTSQVGNIGGLSDFTGTAINPLHVNEDIKSIDETDDGLTLNFIAPVYDDTGKVIAIWNNYAKFALVEDIFISAYKDFKAKGLGDIELTLLNEKGEVIIDYDPSLGRGSENSVAHDFSVLFKLNLAESGVSAAVKSVKGKQAGFEYAMHARKKITQAAGYARHTGALGFPGMPWSVLARAPDEVVNSGIIAIENKLAQVAILFFGIIAVFGFWRSRALTKPVIKLKDNLEKFADGELKQLESMNVVGGDEIGRLTNSYNELLNGILVFMNRADDLLQGKIPEAREFGLKGEFEDKLRSMRDQAEELNRSREDLRQKVDDILLVVDAASRGDLTNEIKINGDDAMGQMADGMRKLLGDFRESISQISSNAQGLASASQLLADTSNQMTSNAEETSAQADSVSAASEQVSQNVDTVATGSEEMNSSIKEIARNASESATVVASAVEITKVTNEMIQELGASSNEIGDVIKVITSIAEQTNLLALNATIEAARAGEAGKGFAVVANEVKELANQTAEATENISNKIQDIQTKTGSSVDAIAEITRIIHQIDDISNTIASAVEEQTATTAEIGHNVSQAAKGSGDIANNISGVAKAAQDTAQGAAEAQKASGDLARMAVELEKIVGRFQI